MAWKTRQLSVRISNKTLGNIEDMSESLECSMSEVVRFAIDNYYKEFCKNGN